MSVLTITTTRGTILVKFSQWMQTEEMLWYDQKRIDPQWKKLGSRSKEGNYSQEERKETEQKNEYKIQKRNVKQIKLNK